MTDALVQLATRRNSGARLFLETELPNATTERSIAHLSDHSKQACARVAAALHRTDAARLA
jgi:hypothetical protein